MSEEKTTVLLLGATSDIARALAQALAKRGHPLQLAGRREEALASLQSDLRIRYGVPVTSAPFEALDMAGHAAFYRGLEPKPQVAICVFGYLGDQEKAETDFDEARRILDTNYAGAVSILNLIAADFARRRQGTIVGISSVAGDRGRRSNYLYGSAKAGFSAYLSGLRNRLFSEGVHVMTVKPGFVATRMTEDLDLPPVVTAAPEQVAADVLRGLDRRRNVIYTRWMWRFIMLALRSIPEPIFKRLST